MYIVLHGRLRAVHMKSGGKKEMVGEFGKGEIVGMVRMLHCERVTCMYCRCGGAEQRFSFSVCFVTPVGHRLVACFCCHHAVA